MIAALFPGDRLGRPRDGDDAYALAAVSLLTHLGKNKRHHNHKNDNQHPMLNADAKYRRISDQPIKNDCLHCAVQTKSMMGPVSINLCFDVIYFL
jgi:hypothetical protein